MKRVTTWEAFEFFKRSEFSNPDAMSLELVLMLDAARRWAGIPFRVTSSFRAGDVGAHGDGEAVDIACDNGKDRMRIVRAAISVGFRRIGVYDRHVHLDVSRERPQDVMWHGISSSKEV